MPRWALQCLTSDRRKRHVVIECRLSGSMGKDLAVPLDRCTVDLQGTTIKAGLRGMSMAATYRDSALMLNSHSSKSSTAPTPRATKALRRFCRPHSLANMSWIACLCRRAHDRHPKQCDLECHSSAVATESTRVDFGIQ